MSRKYFGTDGIRGRVGDSPVTPDFMLKLGWATGKVFVTSDGILVHDEKLASTSVLARMGHRQGTRTVLAAVDFAVDGVAGTPGARHAASPLTGIGAAALGHEPRNDAMEGQTVVEAFFRQLHKVRHCVGGVVIEHLQADLPCLGVHQNSGQSAVVKVPS